ncbi:hypothetical protein SOVF_001730 [Spinacia oleracea]|nr:hypothetical protein SOVF_001730 [Spinacia oleracea]
MTSEFADDVSYLTFLPISLIFVVICLVSLLKKKSKAVMAVVDNGFFRNEQKLQRLKCSVKNYDWGKIGSDSEVYRLFSANYEGNKLDPNKPYAEFWMGTHESGPSHMAKKGKVSGNVNNGGDTLKSWIEKNPNVLGRKVVEKWGYDLPFLFKALSVAKTLSIQAHPCKELAKKLHIKDPSVYKDGNHKPEMALAVTKFEILCGFVGIEELQKILKGVPEISQLVGAAVVDQLLNITPEDEEGAVKAALKQLFTQIMSASEHVIAEVLSQLIPRLRKKDALTSEEKLVLRLEKEYPGDVGVLAAFLMNYVTLNPGEALCLGANELHAYVSGDCIECMATSDNVVRAGLTPKKRDVKTLCDMLTYKVGRPDILRGFSVEGTDGRTKRYRPPFEEFEVDHCDLPEGTSTKFPAMGGPSLFLVTEGTGIIRTTFSVEMVRVGDVLFAPANTKISIESSGRRFQLYRAGVNSKFL